MGGDLYEVWVGPSMIATGMNLDVTMILVEALIRNLLLQLQLEKWKEQRYD